MKITNHKDGSRSYTFSNAEQVHGSEEHVKALTEMAICSGGINSMLHCLLCGSEGNHVGMGTESLTVLLKIAERAKHTPYGQGCLTAALLCVIGSVIQEAGDIPSGVLYAAVMRHVDLQGYERAIDTLVKSGLVQRLPNHMLTWVGPEKQTETKL